MMTRTWSVVLCVLLAGCGVATGSSGVPGTQVAPEPLPPPGLGTLHQDEISVNMAVGPLRVMITPLAESVIRMASPDTYQRLSGLVTAHRVDVQESRAGPSPTLFLVSLFTDASGIGFDPQDLQLVSGGVRVRPSAIIPLTPGWSRHRLEQRRTDQALYVFPGSVDLESDDLIFMYGDRESAQWRAILARVRDERARVRARAGGGS